ncbi:MAG: hypothetical protein ACN6OP_11415 [Pseudomonadales bacterium]
MRFGKGFDDVVVVDSNDSGESDECGGRYLGIDAGEFSAQNWPEVIFYYFKSKACESYSCPLRAKIAACRISLLLADCHSALAVGAS